MDLISQKKLIIGKWSYEILDNEKKFHRSLISIKFVGTKR